MEGSYTRVHYGLRPAKHIERKMLVEAFRRLFPFRPPDQYRYIGLGSIYFVDFILIHKALGIRDMVSIERRVQDRYRFEFNRPYECVVMAFGESGDQLPLLEWDKPTILWLDYDNPLEAGHLEDINTFVARANAGDVIVISINVHPNKRGASNLLQELEDRVGLERIPLGTESSALREEGLGVVSHVIMTNQIQTSLSIRNSGVVPGQQLAFRQLVHFRYRDGAMMLTLGGIFFNPEQDDVLNACRFEDLSFIRAGNEPYLIDPPKLTYRELRSLDSQLPCDDASQLTSPGIAVEDLRHYADVYRFYPTYAETELS